MRAETQNKIPDTKVNIVIIFIPQFTRVFFAQFFFLLLFFFCSVVFRFHNADENVRLSERVLYVYICVYLSYCIGSVHQFNMTGCYRGKHMFVAMSKDFSPTTRKVSVGLGVMSENYQITNVSLSLVYTRTKIMWCQIIACFQTILNNILLSILSGMFKH